MINALPPVFSCLALPWHNIAPPSGMPIRKGRKAAAHPHTKGQKKPRLHLPTQSTKGPEDNNLLIPLTREKDYAWIIEQIKREFQHKRRTPMPANLKPMLASSLEEPFNDDEWQFEIKWDGYRGLAYVSNGKADLRSRNNQSFNRRFPQIIGALKEWPVNAVVDGEIVVLSEEGKADFSALQAWEKEPSGELLFFLFDILWIEGIDLQREPLSVRREVLKRIVPDSGLIRFSDSIEQYGIDFFKTAKENGLEGIIAKKKHSLYKEGSRSKEWYKIKADVRHEAIICGYTKNKDTDRLFSSLILGVPEGDSLRFIGQVGTGFTQKLQEKLMRRFIPLTTNQCPFAKEPRIQAFQQWLRPHLLCEVKYTELTRDGLMRHPSFEGLREDKAAFEFNLEEDRESKQHQYREALQSREKLVQKEEEATQVTIEEKQLKLTNLSKLYWQKERITKGDLLNYYHAIAPYMLPYMLGRPQSLNRFPNGINGESFYQKNMKGMVDSWLTTFERMSESSGEAKDFLVCTGEASLLYMANLACIEMNPWHSRIQKPQFPDWCVIDLDPGNISFEKVVETAQVVHQLLESLGVPSYPKTSGSTGIHVYIPLGAKYSYEQSRQLAELIAVLVHQETTSFTSLERNPQKRKEKIYIDFLQNRPIQTICAPYSIRPKPAATVSAPLHWEEVKKGLQQTQFTIRNILKRVKREGDLFTGVLGQGINLNEVLKTLAAIL